MNKYRIDWNRYEDLQKKMFENKELTQEEHDFYVYMYHVDEFEAYGEV